MSLALSPLALRYTHIHYHYAFIFILESGQGAKVLISYIFKHMTLHLHPIACDALLPVGVVFGSHEFVQETQLKRQSHRYIHT